MRRVLFLNRFFAPDHSATSQLLGDVATHLAAHGHDVHAVTSRQLYEDPQARLPVQESINGVQIHRIATTQFGRSRLTGRAIDYLSFYLGAWRALLRLTRPGDILVAMTDPPLISLVAMRIAKHRGGILINWLQDLYPEVAAALNVPAGKGPLLRTITYLRDRSLKLAAANVVVGSLMADKVAERGVPRAHIHVISNWTDDQKIVPIPANDNLLRRQLGLSNKFVIGYSGNLGRAHESETILAAAERLRNDFEIVFLCIGGGHQMGQLVSKAHERGLSNFRFCGYQDQAALRFSLSVPDVHWVSLRPELEGLIVPSKFYGIAAAGRPIIAICARDGEISRVVEHHQCGLIVEPGDAGALVEAILRLSKDVQLRAKMGQRARAMLANHFTRQQALQRWQNLLDDLAESRELQTANRKYDPSNR